MADTLREDIAQWLFKKKNSFPNPRFYARWGDEIEACPLTGEEYLKLAEFPINLFLQALEKVKPLGDEEMTQAEIAYVKKHNLSYFPVRGKYRDDCIAQAAHRNVIDQMESLMG